MLRSVLIGLVAGSRAITPLAAVSDAVRRGRLTPATPALDWLGRPAVTVLIAVLAAGELFGDKMASAPDRIVPAGIAARLATGGIAGAALAPRGRALLGAALGAAAAVGAAYLTFNARMHAMRRGSQTSTGLVEDAATLVAAQLAVRGA